MENENTDRTLQIALGSYDRKELRVQKNYIQEQCAGSECTCFQNGSRLLEQLQQGQRFDAVILCSQLEDMSGLELLTELRTTEARPPVLMIDEARRQNSSILCPESGEGLCYVGRTELRSLLWELYRMPGRQNRQMERRCQELYEEFPIVKDTTPNMMNPRLYTTSYNKPQGQQFDDTAVLSFIKLQYT